MILAIRLSNFYSIKEEICIDFRAGKINTATSRKLSSHIFTWNDEVVLKSIGLFGANASGKSNIIKAITLCHLVRITFFNENSVFNSSLLSLTDGKIIPALFDDFVYEGIEYEYSFSLTKHGILQESLYYYPKGKKAKVFTRDERIKGEKAKKYSFADRLIPNPLDIAHSTSEKTLYVSRGSQMDREICKTVFRFYMNEITLGLVPDSSEASFALFEKNKDLVVYALNICDSDIVDIKAQREQVMNVGPSIVRRPDSSALASASVQVLKRERVRFVTYHAKAPTIPFDLESEESSGTYRLFLMLLTLIDVVRSNKTFFLDEFDASLHSILSQFILDLFHASSSAQFLYSSHDTNLINLDSLRRDQILFVRKQSNSSTEVYSLYDYKDFRENMDAEKGYLQGRFDAVPIVQSSVEVIKKLLGNNEDGLNG